MQARPAIGTHATRRRRQRNATSLAAPPPRDAVHGPCTHAPRAGTRARRRERYARHVRTRGFAQGARRAMAPPPRVVFVTGCSEGGIGWHLCVAFAAAGCRVFATARKVESMAGLAERGCVLLACDVTDEASNKAAVAAVLAQAGQIDVCVNNAGCAPRLRRSTPPRTRTRADARARPRHAASAARVRCARCRCRACARATRPTCSACSP